MTSEFGSILGRKPLKRLSLLNRNHWLSSPEMDYENCSPAPAIWKRPPTRAPMGCWQPARPPSGLSERSGNGCWAMLWRFLRKQLDRFAHGHPMASGKAFFHAPTLSAENPSAAQRLFGSFNSFKSGETDPPHGARKFHHVGGPRLLLSRYGIEVRKQAAHSDWLGRHVISVQERLHRPSRHGSEGAATRDQL